MPFTVPNEAAATHADQAELHEADLIILQRAEEGTGCHEGCAVTQQGVPNMTVAVAAGKVLINNTPYYVTAQNSGTITADGSNPRFVLIEVDTAGAVQVNTGTAAADPTKPTPTASRAVLAEIFVPAADTAIGTAQIVDKRVQVRHVEKYVLRTMARNMYR